MDYQYMGFVPRPPAHVQSAFSESWDYDSGDAAITLQPRFGIWPREGALAQLSLDTTEVELTAPVEVRETTSHSIELVFPTDPLEGVRVRFEWRSAQAVQRAAATVAAGAPDQALEAITSAISPAARTLVTGRIYTEDRKAVGGEFHEIVERALEHIVTLPIDGMGAAMPAAFT